MKDAVAQRNAISAGGHPGMHSLVRRVSVKLPASGRNDARTWSVGRPLDDQTLGRPLLAIAGKGVSQAYR